MKNLVSKDLRLYFKQIKSLLPLYGKQERRFLENFKEDVEDYIERNPNATINDITAEFGEATYVAASYIENLESEDLNKRLSLKKMFWYMILAVVMVAFAFAVFAFAVFEAVLLYKEYLAAQDAHMVREETTIIIEESSE